VRGLMFKPELTLANLAGRKTRTSREYGLKKINEKPDEWYVDKAAGDSNLWVARNHVTGCQEYIKCPYGKVGSELYGAETYGIAPMAIHYRADNSFRSVERCLVEPHYGLDSIGWKSSMMMPEWASRYHVILNKIICQRINDISVDDILAEGLATTEYFLKGIDGTAESRLKKWLLARRVRKIPLEEQLWYEYLQPCFENLWDSINLKTGHGWEKNEWVWGLFYDVKLKENKQ